MIAATLKHFSPSGLKLTTRDDSSLAPGTELQTL